MANSADVHYVRCALDTNLVCQNKAKGSSAKCLSSQMVHFLPFYPFEFPHVTGFWVKYDAEKRYFLSTWYTKALTFPYLGISFNMK